MQNEITSILNKIFNLSLQLSNLPDDWKLRVSVVSRPILHRRGTETIVNNYRPVSLTSILCKILKSIIRDHLVTD